MMDKQKRDYLKSKKGYQTIILMVEITLLIEPENLLNSTNSSNFTSSHVTCLKATDV